MYDFIVDFIGTVPSEFSFIYVILTLIFSITILGTFTHFFYFLLDILKGGR